MSADFDPTVLDKKPKPDGGPAFPSAPELGKYDVFVGMSMRDHFAAQALVGVTADRESRKAVLDYYDQLQPEMALAKACYQIADAMLAERAKP